MTNLKRLVRGFVESHAGGKRQSSRSLHLPSQSPSMYEVWLARTLRSELMDEKKPCCCCDCCDNGVDTYDTFDEVERAELDLRV